MGTSTVHRSPSQSPHWRVVNNLYRNPTVQRERLLAEIFKAAEHPYVTGLRGPEVYERLQLLLRSASERPKLTTRAAALEFARELIGKARNLEAHSGFASFYSDIANRALHSTVITSQPGSSARGLVQTFLANVVGTCIDHVVSRDLSAHLGTRPLPDTKSALALARDLRTAASQVARSESLSRAIQAAAKAPAQRWGDLISDAWSVGASSPKPAKGRSGQ